ncbi:hypothetical protein F511_16566 [Dorcoceras hygrometricum]|uniref:Uncharacterized protein n=1 Tax=Dorcoceras hygrometricum TaxID=472368 RepID=A0A2Z7B1S6_9LAMI|nr:hypothetical protein F511_16566 [Dorcoceras hygrometricum]
MDPQHHAQPISRWKSSIRDLQLIPQQILREPDHSINSPLNPSASPAHGKTQQKLLESSNLSRYLTNQLKSKLIQLMAYGRELNPISTMICRTNQLKSKLKTRRNHLLESSKEQKNCFPEFSKTFELCNYFVLPQRVDPSLQTSINRKILKRRVQRHQSYSKRRRKSTAIDGKRARMNIKATMEVNHSNLDATSYLGAISNLSANSDLTLLRYPRAPSPNDVALESLSKQTYLATNARSLIQIWSNLKSINRTDFTQPTSNLVTRYDVALPPTINSITQICTLNSKSPEHLKSDIFRYQSPTTLNSSAIHQNRSYPSTIFSNPLTPIGSVPSHPIATNNSHLICSTPNPKITNRKTKSFKSKNPMVNISLG